MKLSYGFSLIEAVVYLALCSLLLTEIVAFMVPTVSLMRTGTRGREDQLIAWSLLSLIARDVAHAPVDRKQWSSRAGGITWEAEGTCGWYVRDGRLWRLQQGVATAVSDNCGLQVVLSGGDYSVRFLDVVLVKGSARVARRIMVWEGFLCNYSPSSG